MTDTLAVVIAAAIIIILAVKLIKKPMRFIFKFIINTVCGFIALIAIDLLAIYIGLGIGIGLNWINAAIVGVFGLPGVAMLLILQLIL